MLAHKVSVSVKVDEDIIVTHVLEQLVENPSESRDFGEIAAHHVVAFSEGFGNAGIDP